MCSCCDILGVYPLQVFKEGNHINITKHRIIYFVYEVQEEVHNTFSFIKKLFLSPSLRKRQVIHEFVEYVDVALVFLNTILKGSGKDLRSNHFKVKNNSFFLQKTKKRKRIIFLQMESMWRRSTDRFHTKMLSFILGILAFSLAANIYLRILFLTTKQKFYTSSSTVSCTNWTKKTQLATILIIINFIITIVNFVGVIIYNWTPKAKAHHTWTPWKSMLLQTM